jgi:hypothetical protein
MTEVFTDPELAVVGYLKSELDAFEIASYIRNQDGNHSVVGAFGPIFWPVLCVTREEDKALAEAVVAQFVAARKSKASSGAKDWVCAHCAESVPGSFDVCWNCDESREAAVDPQ